MFRCSFDAILSLAGQIAAVALVAWLLSMFQRTINTYWDSMSDSPSLDVRQGVGEVVFAILGVIQWAISLAFVFSEIGF